MPSSQMLSSFMLLLHERLGDFGVSVCRERILLSDSALGLGPDIAVGVVGGSQIDEIVITAGNSDVVDKTRMPRLFLSSCQDQYASLLCPTYTDRTNGAVVEFGDVNISDVFQQT